jgi:hypothetical protein
MKYFLALLVAAFFLPKFAHAEEIIDITFPLESGGTFSDDFTDARSGHVHHATDIMAPKMTKILAPVSGKITFAPTTQPSYGYMLSLRGDDGYKYNFIHINNDTPGTDDGKGGVDTAYAPGIRQGVSVERGQFIAYVGDSGNAESVGSHLHFEIYDGETAINPYPSLVAAFSSYSYSVEAELAGATSINDDQDIQEADGSVNCVSDTLIRTASVSTVYYCGRDGGRYAFQNEGTYFSWYKDFSNVQIVTSDEMASIPLKGVVTYKPGSFMLKLPSSPKVYAISANGTLRLVPTPELAKTLYGADWSKKVKDLPESFFPAYTIGEDITRR